MLNKFNTLSLSFLFLMFVLSFGTTTAFATETNELTFSNLDDIKPGECVEYNVTNSKGLFKFTKKLISSTATSKTWLVDGTFGIINAQFLVQVSNNQITFAGYPKIITIGATYSDQEFNWNSHCVWLSFKVTDYFGIVSGTCWLRACVTGSNNDINVGGSF